MCHTIWTKSDGRMVAYVTCAHHEHAVPQSCFISFARFLPYCVAGRGNSPAPALLPPKLVFSLLKDKDLRAKLREVHLSDQGTKQVWSPLLLLPEGVLQQLLQSL
jgi:hypothetical protein